MLDSPDIDGTVRIVIRSSRRLLRDALASCLEHQPGLTVVGHVAGDRDLLHLCILRRPHLVLYDPGACVTASLSAVRTLRSRFEDTRFVLMYEEMSSADLATAWQAGADNLLPFSHGLDALLTVLHHYAEALRAGNAGPAPPEGDLTEPEREILGLISAGHNANRIAELLGISPLAVDSRKRRIYHKLGVTAQSQAVARATALGLVERQPATRSRSPRRDGAPLAVLRGSDTPARQQVVTALLSGEVPFAIETSGHAGDHDQWSQTHPGPVVVVLVDPSPEDWTHLDLTDAPLLHVRSRPLSRGEALDLVGHGVAAIIAADMVDESLVPALRLAAAGALALDPATATAVVTAVRAGPGEPDSGVPGLPELTAREHDILESIASGHTVRQTARALGIAPKTVENIQARLFRKLGARNRAGALATAHTLGLVHRAPNGRPDVHDDNHPAARRPTNGGIKDHPQGKLTGSADSVFH